MHPFLRRLGWLLRLVGVLLAISIVLTIIGLIAQAAAHH